MENKKSKTKRVRQGVVISDKMAKTVTVQINRLKEHGKYKKRFVVSKKLKAHDAKQEAKKGDTILIESCRPISKDKHWRLIKVVKKATLIF